MMSDVIVFLGTEHRCKYARQARRPSRSHRKRTSIHGEQYSVYVIGVFLIRYSEMYQNSHFGFLRKHTTSYLCIISIDIIQLVHSSDTIVSACHSSAVNQCFFGHSFHPSAGIHIEGIISSHALVRYLLCHVTSTILFLYSDVIVRNF